MNAIYEKETAEEYAPNLNSEVKVTKLNFAEGISNGMTVENALKNCLPSTPKELTKFMLLTCIEAGASAASIAKAFSVKPSDVFNYCKRYKLKIKPATELTTGDAQIVPDEFIHVFGVRPIPFPQIRIRKSGVIVVAGCEIDLEEKYVLECTGDFAKVRLVRHEEGFLLRRYKGSKCLVVSCAAISRAIREKGIELSAKYQLDTKTLIGELVV